jgi:hypothetical protein
MTLARRINPQHTFVRRLLHSSSSLLTVTARSAGPPPLLTTVRLLAPAAGARESPTPIALFAAPDPVPHAADAFAALLARDGFNVGLVSLPADPAADAQRSPAARPGDSPLDALIHDLHAALQGPPFVVPPLAVAFGACAPLVQKYLETYPLAGIVLVNPLPPACGPFLVKLMRRAGVDEAAAVGPAPSLPPSPLAGGPPVAVHSRSLALALDRLVFSGLAGRKENGDGGRVQDSAAPIPSPAALQAASLLSLLAAEPVNLEPQPVPLLVLHTVATDRTAEDGGSHAPLLSREDVESTVAFHALERGEDGEGGDGGEVTVPACGGVRGEALVGAGPFGVAAPPEGTYAALKEAMWPWVSRRF